MGRGSVTTEQASEQMPMPVCCNAKREQVGGAAGSTRAFLEAARASRKPAEKNYGEWRRRSVRSAIRQLFVLSKRDIFSLLVSLLL